MYSKRVSQYYPDLHVIWNGGLLQALVYFHIVVLLLSLSKDLIAPSSTVVAGFADGAADRLECELHISNKKISWQ